MAEKATAEIRVIKRGRSHAGHHGGAWKVAYADFMTAMMAFFLVMWIVGLSQNVKTAIAGYFKDPVGFMKSVEGGKSPFGVSGLDSGGVGPKKGNTSGDRARLEKTKKAIEQIMSATPEFKDVKKFVEIKLVKEGLKIDLLDAQESLFFDSGSAKIKPATQKLLNRIAVELKKLPNNVIIEGHTDNRPLARADGYTNWELSADRANAARRVMENAGLHKNQIDQVRGYAATHPRDTSNPAHFSNRRVSIIVVTDAGIEQAVKTEDIQPENSNKDSKAGLDPANPLGVDVGH